MFTLPVPHIVTLKYPNILPLSQDKHFCDFRKHNVTCTTSSEEMGSMDAVDDLGDATKANYTRYFPENVLSRINKALVAIDI